MRVKVTFKATETATGELLVAVNEFDAQSDEHLAKMITQTLFSIGQTGFVKFDQATRIWSLVVPARLGEITAERDFVEVAQNIPAAGLIVP